MSSAARRSLGRLDIIGPITEGRVLHAHICFRGKIGLKVLYGRTSAYDPGELTFGLWSIEPAAACWRGPGQAMEITK